MDAKAARLLVSPQEYFLTGDLLCVAGKLSEFDIDGWVTKAASASRNNGGIFPDGDPSLYPLPKIHIEQNKYQAPEPELQELWDKTWEERDGKWYSRPKTHKVRKVQKLTKTKRILKPYVPKSKTAPVVAYTIRDYVLQAEELEKEYGGLPHQKELVALGYQKLVYVIYKNPIDFGHIRRLPNKIE